MGSVRIVRTTAPRVQHRNVNKRGVVVRALEGRYRWGDFRVGTPGRTGWVTYRLSVYPPGTNAAERRTLQFWYSWPSIGALICLLAFAVLGDRIAPLILVSAAGVVYVGGIVAGWALTRRVRPAVIRLNVAQFPDNGDIQTLGDLTTLSTAVHALRSMDERRWDGKLTELGYEREWWSVYELLDAHRSLGNADLRRD
jgi:hypothetical protein